MPHYAVPSIIQRIVYGKRSINVQSIRAVNPFGQSAKTQRSVWTIYMEYRQRLTELRCMRRGSGNLLSQVF